jgi:alpha-galactosidase
VPKSTAKYLAVFNAADKPKDSDETTAPVSVDLKELGFDGPSKIEDLWTGKPLGSFTGEFKPTLPFHGSGLYRVEPEAK